MSHLYTYLQVDKAYSNWYYKRFGIKLDKRMALPINDCLQGLPSSGHLYMKLIDKILGALGFSSAVHDRCIYRGEMDGKMVLVLRQIDIFCIGAEDESTVRELTTLIGKKNPI